MTGLDSLHRTLIETMPAGVIVADVSGAIILANSHARTLLGGKVTGDAFGPRGGYRLLRVDGTPYPPEELPLPTVLGSGRPVADSEILLHREDGSEAVLLVRASPVRDGQGRLEGAVAILQDISGRKAMERELAESEQRFRVSVESLLDGFAIFSAVRNTAGVITDFRFEYINDAGARLNRHPARDTVGKTLLGLLPEHRSSGLFAAYVEVVEKGRPLIREAQAYSDVYGGRRQERIFDFRAVRLGDGFSVAWREVTESRQAEAALRDSEERFRKVFTEGPIGMALVDLDFRFVRVNPRLCRMLGYTEAELTGSLFADITYPPDLERDLELAARLVGGEIPFYTLEKRYLQKGGRPLWSRLTASLLRTDAGQPRYGIAMIEDITEQKTLEASLVQAAETDRLTGLYNRQALDARLRLELERCMRYERDLGVIMLDIDHFKAINDRHGHLVGDQVLQAVALALRRNLRSVDHLGRWGGEEFLLLLPESDLAATRAMAEKLRGVLAGVRPPPLERPVTASFGVTSLQPGDTRISLVRRADDFLYRAKRSGRDRVESG